MILSAQSIANIPELITPFSERGVAHGMSYGLSACGYDIRTDREYEVQDGNFVLIGSLERFKVPNNLCMKVLDKSSWARQGVFVQNTIAEPGWEGFLTLEVSFHNRKTVWNYYKLFGRKIIPAGCPIAQVLFEQLDEPTILPYKGKYQNQQSGPVEWIEER